MFNSLDELGSFKLRSLNIVQWLVIIFCLIIVSFKLVFLYNIGNIESNKA